MSKFPFKSKAGSESGAGSQSVVSMLSRFSARNLRDKRFVVIFVLLFAAVGTSILILTKAASKSTSIEVEKGNLSGLVSVGSDQQASGGQYVQFGASPTPSPTPTPPPPSTSGPVRFVNSSFANSSKGIKSFTVNKPAGVQEGDVMVAMLGGDYGIPDASPGWTKYAERDENLDLTGQVFYKVATANEPASYTWNIIRDAGKAIASGTIAAFRGVDRTNPMFSQAINPETTRSNEWSDCPSTNGINGGALICTWIHDDPQLPKAPADMISLSVFNTPGPSGADDGHATAYQLLTKDGPTGVKSAALSLSISGGRNDMALAVVLRPAPAGTTPSPTPTPTPTPTPPPPPGPGPSGEAMPVGDLPGWKQVFTDDFTTDLPLGSFSGCNGGSVRQCSGLPSAIRARWWAYNDGWPDTGKHGQYYPSKVISWKNGIMNMNLHTENGIHMVSAPNPIIPGAPGSRGGMLYGRYAVRFRADPVKGYKTAWLLWPDSGKSAGFGTNVAEGGDGEIDFPEGDLNETIKAALHYQGAKTNGDQKVFKTNTTYTGWHTGIFEWMPNRVNFILDGQNIGTVTERIPNTPMHYILQTETGLDGTLPNNTDAGNVQIDWIAIWKYQP